MDGGMDGGGEREMGGRGGKGGRDGPGWVEELEGSGGFGESGETRLPEQDVGGIIVWVGEVGSSKEGMCVVPVVVEGGEGGGEEGGEHVAPKGRVVGWRVVGVGREEGGREDVGGQYAPQCVVASPVSGCGGCLACLCQIRCPEVGEHFDQQLSRQLLQHSLTRAQTNVPTPDVDHHSR